MKKQIFTLFTISLCCLFSLSYGQNVWDGSTDTDWYSDSGTEFTLTTAEELAGLAELVNENGKTFENQLIKLGANILLNDVTGWDDKITDASWNASGVLTPPAIDNTGLNKWTPIGNDTYVFKGTFDGAGKTITGMYIEDDILKVGFFGTTGGASTLTNIKIEKLFVKATTITNWADAPRVGGLVGLSKSKLIENCELDGLVCAYVTVAGAPYCGGLVGETGRENGNPEIVNCRTNGDVFSYAANNSAIVGGLAGYLSYTVIKDCRAHGDIYASSSLSDIRTSQTGGLVGMISYGSVENSYARGNVTSKRGNARVGGLAGQVRGSENQIIVDNSYSVGIASYENESETEGDCFAGGSVGALLSGELRNCYYNSDANTEGLGDGTSVGMPVGKTVAEMLSADFVELLVTGRETNWTWEHNSEINNGYPYQVPSTNADLASLTVSVGTLTPAFSKDVLLYEVEVASDTESITISVTLDDSNATKTGDGTHNVTVGDNTFDIVVTAQDGITEKTYIVKVKKSDLSDVEGIGINKNTTVYPNPVISGELNVKKDNFSIGEIIEIYNMYGGLIEIYKITNEITTLNLSHLNSGSYIIKVGGQVSVIIKQ